MRFRPCQLLAITVLLATGVPHLAAAQEPGGPPFLVLLGARLIDGTGAEPVEDSALVIGGDRILYAGRRGDIEIPTSATVLDVAGLTVLPGIINSHVHNGLSETNLRAWARAGVTTVRDLGSTPSGLALFRRLYPPQPDRARLVAAGPLITVPNGYPTVPFGSATALPVATLAEARSQAERLLDTAVDLLKLALETGAVFGRTIPTLSLDQAQLLVRVAHGRGTVVSAHVTSVVDLELALDAGVDDLAHMVADRQAPDELLHRVVSQGVFWVPTLELWQCTPLLDESISNLRRFVVAGGRVAVGTDFAGYTCDFDLGLPMSEMELMVRAGMSPEQIIVAATANAAAVCNLESELGTLEKGKLADLVVVQGDPLVDLQALRDVKLVLHGGVPIRNELPARAQGVPRRVTSRIGR